MIPISVQITSSNKEALLNTAAQVHQHLTTAGLNSKDEKIDYVPALNKWYVIQSYERTNK